MAFGLSGTAGLGLSGTGSSDYQEPKWPVVNCKYWKIRPLNLANKESFGFFLTDQRLSTDKPGPPDLPAVTQANGEPRLTLVTLFWREGKHEDWLRFGKPIAEKIVSRSQRIECYAPGQVFGLVRWASNDYGTIRSSLEIVRAVTPGDPVTPIVQVSPGGEVLLAVHGWPNVVQVFRLIDAIEASGIDPCEVAPDHWRHIHNRMAARETPRDYAPARHRAWLRRRDLQP